MAIIDPSGLFGGDRLRRCSNTAQLHWPRLFLASDGFARLEINYAKIIGRAYPTFTPVPSEDEVRSLLQEYVKNSLLFMYQVDGQVWGQWDTRKELLPKYKTSVDRRSPIPPEPAFTAWKARYRQETKAFVKCFDNLSETFLHGGGIGVGVGIGKTLCPSENDGRVGGGEPSKPEAERPSDGNDFENPSEIPQESLEGSSEKSAHGRGSAKPINIDARPGNLFDVKPSVPKARHRRNGNRQLEQWFEEWWEIYWRRDARKAAEIAFAMFVVNEPIFIGVMKATRQQYAEMMQREKQKRPMGSTWIRGERWNDETVEPKQPKAADPYVAWNPDVEVGA